MKVQALDNFDSVKKGQIVDLPTSYAEGVVKKGLAKMAGEVENKMEAAPANRAKGSGKGKPA